MKLTRSLLFAFATAGVVLLAVLVAAFASLFSDGGEGKQAAQRVEMSVSEQAAMSEQVVHVLYPEPDVVAAAEEAARKEAEEKARKEKEEEEARIASENAAAAAEEEEREVLRAQGPGCRLVDAATIALTAELGSMPVTDDDVLYVYELAPYQYSLEGAAQIATTAVSQKPAVSFPFAGDGAVSRLYCKFVFAANVGGTMTMLGEPQYITNPELLATNTKPRSAYPTKSIQGHGTCHNYYLDRGYGGEGMMLIVNNTGQNAVLKHPAASSPDSHMVDEGPLLYMFNAANADGVNALASGLKNLAASHNTQDFVIGNEVNERKWCYVAYMDWDQYVREYVQSFRVAYNAIKSTNANARIFFSVSQDWDRNRPSGSAEYYWYLDSKDFIAKFNSQIRAGGNIDWCIACHPHTVPLTYSKFWDMSGLGNGGYFAAQISSGAMMSFQNLSLLTNYLQSPELLSPAGKVRPVIASETAIAGGQGAEVQGAALYASFQASLRNPYIETIIYLEDPTIGAVFSGKAREVYDAMGGPEDAAYDAWAKAVIGISDWGQVLR
ncbi:MAG: hypothetical protein IK115_05420 [Lachnospiraceae bacterium]|nr:hypothetical protein [Lachnospiraceae bacterium]